MRGAPVVLAWAVAAWMGGLAAPAGAMPPQAPIYYPVLEPNEMPLPLRFSAIGRPVQRQAGRLDAGYAVLQLPLQPGQTYLLLFSTPGDPARLRVVAFDDDPLGEPSARTELALQPLGPRVHRSIGLVATVRTPADAAVNGVFLLAEWLPGHGPAVQPPTVFAQALAVYPPLPGLVGFVRPATEMTATQADMVRSPLQTPSPDRLAGRLGPPAVDVVQELAVPRLRPDGHP